MSTRSPWMPAALIALAATAQAAGGPTVNVTYPASLASGPLDGRLLLLLSTDDKEEPRFQISDTELGTQQVFGIEVDGWKAGALAPHCHPCTPHLPLFSGLAPPSVCTSAERRRVWW